jgi:hypothetical protein
VTLRECLAIREKRQPDLWKTFNTQSMLGQSLAKQKKYADAEKLLLSGYDGMRQREAKIPLNGRIWLTKAVEGLIDFYEQNDKKAEADKWRKELEKLKAQKN